MTARGYRIALASVAAACAAVLLAGCVLVDEKAVAVVDGEHKITAADVKFYYERGAAAGEWPTSSTA
jgi:hypothetical protein